MFNLLLWSYIRRRSCSAKGIGGWFINKLIPTNKTVNPKSIKETNITSPSLEKNSKLIVSSGNADNFIKTSKKAIEEKKEQLYTPNSISIVKKKAINHNYYYTIEQKQKRNVIDTNA